MFTTGLHQAASAYCDRKFLTGTGEVAKRSPEFQPHRSRNNAVGRRGAFSQRTGSRCGLAAITAVEAIAQGFKFLRRRQEPFSAPADYFLASVCKNRMQGSF